VPTVPANVLGVKAVPGRKRTSDVLRCPVPTAPDFCTLPPGEPATSAKIRPIMVFEPTGSPAGKQSDDSYKLVRRLRAGAEQESIAARARTWRTKTVSERVTAFVGALRMSDYVAHHRAQPYRKEPLAFPRFSSAKGSDAKR